MTWIFRAETWTQILYNTDILCVDGCNRHIYGRNSYCRQEDGASLCPFCGKSCMESIPTNGNKMETILVNHHGNLFYIYLQCHLDLNVSTVVYNCPAIPVGTAFVYLFVGLFMLT